MIVSAGATLALAALAMAMPQPPRYARPHPELYRPGERVAPRPYYENVWVSSAGEDGEGSTGSDEPSGYNSATGSTGTTARTLAQDLPAAIVPPAGANYITSLFAAGTQNYVCNTTTGTPTWNLVRPEAYLYPPSANAFAPRASPIGFHFFLDLPGDSGGGRATWTLTRAGARVTTKLVASAPSPDGATNIPWLLTQTTSLAHSAPGNPLFKVGFVVRYNTISGVAPPVDQCTVANSGQIKHMPYSALYGFFEPVPA